MTISRTSIQETETLVPRLLVTAAARPAAGAAAAVAAACFMAGYVVLGKQFVSAEEFKGDPNVLLISRQLVAAALMALGATARHGWQFPELEDRKSLQLLGVLNFINGMGFVWGMKLTTAFITSVMQLSIPVSRGIPGQAKTSEYFLRSLATPHPTLDDTCHHLQGECCW